MGEIFNNLAKSALKLPLDQRAELAAMLLDSVPDEPDVEDMTEAEWHAELKRRVDSIGEEPGYSWDEVEAELKEILVEARKRNHAGTA